MKKTTLPLALVKLIETLESKKDFKPSEIVRIIKNAELNETDLTDWSDFDHDKKDGYGRKLIHAAENFEIMIMSWAPGDFSAIHNHGYTKWGAVQSFGELEHTSFQFENDRITTLLKEHLDNGQVLSVNQGLIHQMGNSTDKNILSLHVYGTPENCQEVTADSQLFEIGKGEIQYTNAGVFYDLKNNSINKREKGLLTDRLTEIGHYTHLLNYYYKSGVKGSQYLAAINYFHNRSFESSLILEMEMDSKHVLYGIELRRARKLLNLLKEDTSTIDSILYDINDLDKYS